MLREISFDNMLACYSKYIADKHRDDWGLNEDVQKENEEYQQGALCFLKNHFSKWVSKHLYSKCVEAKFDVDSEIEDCGDVYKVKQFDVTSPMEDNVVAPFMINGWKGECYIIKLGDKDDIGRFLMILGQMLHDYGVASEKHQERGLVDPDQRDLMFRAMIVENLIGELYPIVEAALYTD